VLKARTEAADAETAAASGPWSQEQLTQLACSSLSLILEQRQVAGREYFGRVWTLAERLARCSWKEGLHQWLPLQLWMGMVVDALLNSTGDSLASDIYWAKLFPEDVREKLTGIVDKIKACTKAGNVRVAPGLEQEVADLCVDSVRVWRSRSIIEVPDLQWLCTYLQSEALHIYKVGPGDRVAHLSCLFIA
jgi:hypothetical protein